MIYDLIIRNGTFVDGSGGQPFTADVAILDGKISDVGKMQGAAREDMDATGRLVTPGFVDIHTHYDGQATWSNRMSPSSLHGVTTVVMGNCGVGFAPCRREDRDSLIRLMEGVEDIPGVVMADGIPWTWETFPEFMDFLASREYDVDIVTQVPHAPLRVYVMGQRGLDREPATPDDMIRMTELTAQAIQAGAIGVATSRSLNHRSTNRQLMPGVSAAESELVALGLGITKGGDGVLQCISDFAEPEIDFALLRRVVERTGLPLSYSLIQFSHAPDLWRQLLAMTASANRDGLRIKGQVFPRPIGAILGLKLAWNMFSFSPSYRGMADIPVADRLERLRDPDTRKRIIGEYPAPSSNPANAALINLDNVFLIGDTLNYEPTRNEGIASRARQRGMRPVDLAYDLMIDGQGENTFYVPAANYADGNLEAVAEMLNHQDTLLGLGDGGAHLGIICDATWTTFIMKRWVGDGSGGTMPLSQVVKAITSDNARAVQLHDRGIIGEGYRADINVIDYAGLSLERPELMHDLPLGAGRLHQRAHGYVASIVAGRVTYRDGQPTQHLPGRLVRGAQRAPRAH